MSASWKKGKVKSISKTSRTNTLLTEDVSGPQIISLEASPKENQRSVPSLPSNNAEETKIPQPKVAFVNSPTLTVKGTQNDNHDDFIAYVHNLSPTKRNKKDTMDYWTLTLQTNEESRREALLYSKSKRKILDDSQKSHTPIKIQRHTYTADGKKVIINDITNITVPNQSEYFFQFNESSSAFAAPFRSVAEISADCNEWDQIAVRVKVVHIANVEVGNNKKLKLTKATLADKIGTIQFNVWKDFSKQIQTGKVYEISPVQVRVWNKTKKLATTYCSVFAEVKDEMLSTIEVTQDQIKSKTDEVTVVVESVEIVERVEKFISCCNPSCSKRILQGTSATVVHCDRCGHTMRSAKCKSHLCAKLILPVKEDNIYLTVFEEVLKTVIAGDLASYTELEIAEMLLLLENITVTYDATTKVVKQIKST